MIDTVYRKKCLVMLITVHLYFGSYNSFFARFMNIYMYFASVVGQWR